MQIKIATRHGHISEKTQAKIEAKVGKLTRFHERLAAADVTIDLENESRPRFELRILADKAGPFVASETSEQLMAACDSVVQKLEQQLKKHKERVTDRHRSGSRKASASEPEAEEDAEEFEFAE